MSKKLTNSVIKAVKATGKDYDLNDHQVDGLALRVSRRGIKTFAFRYYKTKGKAARFSIGRYDPQTMSLERARAVARKARQLATEGQDPKLANRQDDGVVTFTDAVNRWYRQQIEDQRKSAKARKRILELHATPVLGDNPIHAIRRLDIVELLEDLRDVKGLGAQVNRVQAAIAGVFTQALSDGLIAMHPASGIKRKVNEEARRQQTELTLDHILKIWRATEGWNTLAAPIIRLLILTGARREEISALSWPEVDLEKATITIPATRFKGKRDHIYCLPRQGVELLTNTQRWIGPYVFSARSGRSPFRGWRRMAGKLLTRSGLVDPDGESLAWTIHEIRRGVATALGEHLHTDPFIISLILGHSRKALQGVTAEYDKSERLDDRRRAIDAWGTLLASEMGEAPPMVVPLRGGRANAHG